ncbi:MAG: alanine racemase [bacterium]|nr:alanine racemase [bacterium]
MVDRKNIRKNITIKVRGKIIEINTQNLLNNIRIVKEKVKGGTKIFSVIKSNAYGHGIKNIVPLIDEFVDGWCVISLEEALLTRKLSKKEIVILKGTSDKTETKEAAEKKFTIVARDLIDLEQKMKSRVPNLLVKFDTGMGRLGILPDEIDKFEDIVQKYKGKSRINGIITHFAYSDFGDPNFIKKQNEIFDHISQRVEKFLGKRIIRTISNSAGTLIGDDFHKDIVRPGICIYGISPFGKEKDFSLKPAMSVKSRVLTIKEIPKGWSVGYSRKFIANERTKIAVIDIGYSDGIPRILWEQGFVSINGKRFKIIGVISMDMLCSLCDNSVKPQDEVQIIGDDISIYEVAEKAQTIPYEILCSVGLKT